MKMKSFVALVVAFAGVNAFAETWYWVGGSSNTYSGGKVGQGLGTYRDWRDGYNWVNSQGERGSLYPDNSKGPGAGDTIIFDNTYVFENHAVGTEYTHTFGPTLNNSARYGALIVRGTSFGASYGSQIPIADGGSAHFELGAGNQSFTSNGSIELYVAGGQDVASHFKTIVTLRKTGTGSLTLIDGDTAENIHTLRLEEGTLKLKMDGVRHPLAHLGTGGIVFDGENTVLNLNGLVTAAKAGAGISETANATGHSITSASAGCLTLHGAQNATTFSGQVTGAASLCWNPNDDVALTLTGDLDTTGTLIVSNGTVDVSAATLGAAVTFEVGGTGKLALPTGFYTGRIVVDGAPIADGAYSSDGSAGTQVAWLSGAGIVYVGAPAGQDALWTEAGSLGVAANWNGATEAPDLTSGLTVLKTTTPVAGAVADVDNVYLCGLDLGGGANFAFTGAKGFWLGGGGITLSGAAKTVSFETPVSVQGSQFWDLSNGGAIHVKTSLGEVVPGTTVTITNGAVKFFGGTHDPSFVYSEVIQVQDATTNVFSRKVVLAQRTAGSFYSGSAGTVTIFNGGLDMCNGSSGGSDCGMNGNGTVIFTNGILKVDNTKRIWFAGGNYHFYSPNNSFNNGQRGYIHGSAVMYFHVTNAFTSTQANLAGYHGDGGTIDLCGCDQTIGSIQCGRGVNNAAGKAAGWKWAVHPGTIRSEKPALLHITNGDYSINPASSSSPTSTNFAYFVGMAGISFDSSNAARGHWLNQECSSTGTVQATNGRIYFSKRVIDGDGCDLGEGSWPNASKVIAKGSGAITVEHSNAFGKNTDVYLEGNGNMQLDEGVVQKCRNLYINGVKQRLGTWGSTASAAKHTSASLTGSGMLKVYGEYGTGTCLLVK